jgi:histidine triad (HIT) family protein
LLYPVELQAPVPFLPLLNSVVKDRPGFPGQKEKGKVSRAPAFNTASFCLILPPRHVRKNNPDAEIKNRLGFWRVGMTCIFCQIVSRQLPATIVFEDQDIAVFKDINPAAPVHLLIVPKKHFDSLNALDEKNSRLLTKMWMTAKKIAEEQKIQNGYRLLINTGREAGQVIFHLHMHLMGGWGTEARGRERGAAR